MVSPKKEYSLRKLIRFCCCLVAAVAAFGDGRSDVIVGNLVQNGSFEEGSFLPSGTSGYPTMAGAVMPTGWTFSNVGIATPDDANYHPKGAKVSPYSYWCAFMHDRTSSPSAKQTVVFPEAGSYTLEMSLTLASTLYWTAATIQAYLGETYLGEFNNPSGGYARKSIVFEVAEDQVGKEIELIFTRGAGRLSFDDVALYRTPNFTVDCEATGYQKSGGATPRIKVFDENGVLVDPANYQVVYEHNVEVGPATVDVRGIGGGLHGSVQKSFNVVKTVRVTEDAKPGRNGLSWTDGEGEDGPMLLDEALTNLPSGVVLLLKEGVYRPSATLAFSTATLRGGYSGTDDFTFASPNSVSVIDGQHSLDVIATFAFGVGTGVVERIEFANAALQAVKKGIGQYERGGRMEFLSCRFIGNGLDKEQTAGGRAIRNWNYQSTDSSELFCSNCVFAGNAAVHPSTGQWTPNWTGYGAVYANNMAKVEITDCTFTTNGVAWSVPLGNNWTSQGGAALYVHSKAISLTKCRFVANRGLGTSNAAGHGIVVLENNGTALWSCGVTNCLFVANEAPGATSSTKSGALVINAANAAAESSVENCTFAYNIINSTTGSAGLSVLSGKALIRNSIFYGNRQISSALKGCDLYLSDANATAEAVYSLFTGTSEKYVASTTLGALTLGEGVREGDPKFVTDLDTFNALVSVVKFGSTNGTLAFEPDDATLAAVMAIDVHAGSDAAPTIDTGDPDSDYSNEPNPNGGRVNMGAYGNTPEAHTTAAVQPEIVDGSLAVTFPYETSQPRVSFRLGGEGDYSADAEILWTTNGTDWVSCETLMALANGAVVDKDLYICFAQGSDLQIKVSVSTSGAAPCVDATSTKVAYPCPPSYGKGGGEGILHVHAGATGDGSGRDWFNAMRAMPANTDSLPHGTEEVWVAADSGDLVKGVTYRFTSPIAIRGGFACSECSASERAPGAMTLLDGEDTISTCLQFYQTDTVSIFTKITLDGFDFARALTQGLSCRIRSGGEVNVLNCAFTANGLLGREWSYLNGGRAVTAYASKWDGGGTFVCSNCTFRGNAAFMTGNVDWQKQQGGRAAVVVESLENATFVDCTFTTNGVAWEKPIGAMDITSMGGGAALYATETPISLTRCEFRANRGIAGDDYYERAIVALANTNTDRPWTCGITNCLFVGNELPSQSAKFTSLSSGALSINDTTRQRTAEIVNCTFAYNIANATTGAAGLSVKAGDVKVRNSVFYGNRQISTATQGSDIFVTKAGASADVDYSFVTSLEEANVAAVEDATLTFGDNMKTGNPKFTTPIAAFDSLVSVTNIDKTATLAFQPDAETLAGVMALDVHEKRRSPVIDTGDPASAWANEPTPNGGRVNMGAYGNTSCAALSPMGLILFIR